MSDSDTSGFDRFSGIDFATVTKAVDTNTIAHHAAVETAAEGTAAGRTMYPMAGNVG